MYTTTGSVAVGAIVNRAWQRRDPGSWTLATALSLVIAGVIAWATAKFGPDLRIPAIMLMVVGVALTPLAISNPGHGRPVVVDKGEERDRLGALAFHLTCWGVAWWHLVHQPMTAPMAVLGTVSMMTIFGRVYVVRRSEQELVSRLRGLAFSDALTGIGNRRTLHEELERSADAWLLTLDLDGFKQVNDTLGHADGDRLLRIVAQALVREVGDLGHAARIGGDEFAAVLHCDRDQAHAAAQRLVSGFDADTAHRFQWITASVGVTQHHRGTDPDTSLRDADVALQEAKRTGKSRVVEINPDLLARRVRELDLAARLRENMAIDVVYQPIVRLHEATSPSPPWRPSRAGRTTNWVRCPRPSSSGSVNAMV